MDQQSLIAQILKDLAILPVTPFGVILYGSQAEGKADERSDIDLCLVAGSDPNPVHLQRQAWRHIRQISTRSGYSNCSRCTCRFGFSLRESGSYPRINTHSPSTVSLVEEMG